MILLGVGIYRDWLRICWEMKSAIRTILLAGIVVGVFDGIAAVIAAGLRGVPPGSVFQYISSGILGRSAYEGGATTIILGVLLHFVVAFGASAVFVLAAGWIASLRRYPLIVGPLYGVAVYFFMSEIVSTLSSVTRQPRNLSGTVVGILIHILFVGLPIALITSRTEQRPSA